MQLGVCEIFLDGEAVRLLSLQVAFYFPQCSRGLLVPFKRQFVLTGSAIIDVSRCQTNRVCEHVCIAHQVHTTVLNASLNMLEAKSTAHTAHHPHVEKRKMIHLFSSGVVCNSRWGGWCVQFRCDGSGVMALQALTGLRGTCLADLGGLKSVLECFFP